MEYFPEDKIIYRLINYKHNRRRLSYLPHRKYLNLAVVYEVAYEMPTGQTFAPTGNNIVTNRKVKKWNIDEDMLYEAAKRNTEQILGYRCVDVYSHLNGFLEYIETQEEKIDMEELFGITKESITGYMGSSDYFPLYLISNRSGQGGASCILYQDALQNLANKISGDIYLILSIDEIAAVPAGKIKTVEDMENLVRLACEMNVECKTSELLSDRLYYYSKDNDELDIIQGIVISRKLSSKF